MQVAAARRVATPSWVNIRTVLGLLLFAAALLAGQKILARADVTVSIWAAARDLPRDTVLQDTDLQPVEVKLPGSVMSRYYSTERDLSGTVLAAPVRAGELVPAEWIEDGESAQAGRSMTVPVTSEHAVGDELRAGDRVDIFATFNPGDLRARTVQVARAVEVVDEVTTGGIVSGEDTTVGVTVAVTPLEARNLAYAIRTAELDLAKVHDGNELLSDPSVGLLEEDQ